MSSVWKSQMEMINYPKKYNFYVQIMKKQVKMAFN